MIEVEARVKIRVFAETEDDAWRILNEVEIGEHEVSVDCDEASVEIEVEDLIG